MKAKAPQLQKNVIEKLEAVLAELGHMQLPQGTRGSVLLDAMEAMEQVRKTLRDEAKGFLLREPKALPGGALVWRMAGEDARVPGANPAS